MLELKEEKGGWRWVILANVCGFLLLALCFRPASAHS